MLSMKGFYSMSIKGSYHICDVTNILEREAERKEFFFLGGEGAGNEKRVYF